MALRYMANFDISTTTPRSVQKGVFETSKADDTASTYVLYQHLFLLYQVVDQDDDVCYIYTL